MTNRDVTPRLPPESRPGVFRDIIERIDDPIMLQDRDGGFRAINEAVAEYAALPREDLLGSDEFAFMDEAAARKIEEKKADVLDTEESVQYEVTSSFPGKGERTFSTIRYPFYEDGDLVGTVAICRDVTGLKQYREQLQRENERLDEFASVISHDLRNPLNVALSRMTLLAEEADSDHVAPAIDALERMEAIISDTLTLARQGDIVEETEPIHLREFVQSSWEMVETGGATLQIDDEFTVPGDPDRLAHVFENLFRNAIEHGGPDVTVRVGRMDDRGFYVEDDGPGVPDEVVDDIFDPGHTTAADGTGFGLTIVRRIAQAHGWEVSYTAGRDGGARFEFSDVSMSA